MPLHFFFFFFNDTATTEIYTLSLHERSSDLPQRGTGNVKAPRFRASPGGIVAQEDKREHNAGDAQGNIHEEEARSEEHTSELQSQSNLVCRLLLEKKKKK